MKYFIVTFGCQMNTADSERIAGGYEARGWQKAKKFEEADEVVINTCSVRQSAEDRVYGLANNLSKLKIKNLKLKIVLTGCMLRLPLKVLRQKLPVVDEFTPLEKLFGGSRFSPKANEDTLALVPISNGCDNFCTYCVVPYARGREKSRPFEEIVCEVKELAKRGYEEITLLGQNVNSYYDDSYHRSGKSFADLLGEIHEITGIQKISFLTSNPWDLTDEIIEVMSLPKIDRYLHLPVQSGDDEILHRMNRRYTAKDYLALVKKIRAKIPEIQIGTDIIVGFPGESEKQFENTVKLVEQVGFVKAYVAQYSLRWGTAAAKLVDDVPKKEKKRRWQILDDLINRHDRVKSRE
ncbi:MAG: MiaB/RimO family radical SAM methylthiotransferase [Candidatus Shapirobacteria bacterium]